MIKFINPRFPDFVFVLPDEASAERYREWTGGHPKAELIEWAKKTFASETGAFVDIGANCGLWTVHLSESFRHVYAFEPNPDTFSRLVAGLILSDVSERVTRLNVALGQHSGIAILRTKGSDAFDASMIQYGAETPGVEVPMNRLSNTLSDRFVALVKIDVEGYEYEVLQGAEEFLRNAGLPPILFESWDANRGQRPFEDTRALLESYGYDVRPISWPEEYLATRRA